jgi:cyclomaltodextrinase / maltogenic alpha-amylase / neopullulanase
MRDLFRAQIGALTLCGLLLVSCASGETGQQVIHPKARKTEAPRVAPSPAVTNVAAPTAVSAQKLGPSSAAPEPAMPEAAMPVPVQLIVSPQPVPSLPASPVIPPLPQAAPPAPKELPSEIPTRASRREVPTWNLPPTKAPLPLPRPAAPPVVVTPPTPPVPIVPLPAPPLAPGVATPPPSSLPVVLPRAPIAVPPPPPALAPATPIATRLAPLTSRTLLIDRPMGTTEARLPCNRGGSPFCDLRIYQINVGTFVDGSSDHNPIGGYGPGPHTGDIEGVIGSLEHIKALGFNTIWLTPIFDSAAGQPQSRVSGPPQTNTKLDGTGYFARDYFKIDPQFGTLEQAETLVDQAHLLGLKVMFDGVFGHHKGGLVPSPTGGLPADATDASGYGGNPSNYPGRIVNYNDPRSTAFYKEVARHWIDTLGIDGWRLDQVYQVPSGTLREITSEITKASNAQLLSGYVVGEMWGTAAQIRDVLGPSSNPALVSAFDFPTRYALVQTLATDENGTKNKPATTINEAWALGAHATYPDQAIMNLMLGNHDLVRFGDLIERAGKGGPTSANYWAIHKMAFTFMAAWSGPITLYYGEEIGAEVAGFSAKVPGDCAALGQCDDHVARTMVTIAGVNGPVSASTARSRDLKLYLTSLMALRTNAPALSSGSRTHIFSDKDLYVDLKASGSERYALVMNISDTPRQIELKASAFGMTRLVSGRVAAGQLRVDSTIAGLALTIPALGAAIIKLEGS